MSIFSFITDIFKPASDIIDELHTSDEEKMKLQNEMAKIQAGTQEQGMKLEGQIAQLQAKLAEEAAKVAVAESKSDSVFTRTYRPAILSGMFILIALNSFGILTHPVPDIFISVFGAAFGVVGLGRTAEKITRYRK